MATMSELQLNKYQSGAVSTVIYPGKVIYPALGLCGEVGELIDFVSIEREHCNTGVALHNIKKEIGDVAWYVANIAEDMGTLLSEVMGREDFQEYTGPWDVDEVISQLAVHAGMVAENVKKAIRDNDGELTVDRRGNIMKALRWTVIWLGRLGSNYGATLEECAQLNLDKLRSRAERGVIKGDGDNR